MEDIKIRPASEADAKLIAQVVVMAMGEESATLLCGAEYLKVLEQIALAEGTQYSYTNALIALVNGEPAGAVLGYDGALLEPLRSATVSVIKKSFSEYSLPTMKRRQVNSILTLWAYFPSTGGMAWENVFLWQ